MSPLEFKVEVYRFIGGFEETYGPWTMLLIALFVVWLLTHSDRQIKKIVVETVNSNAVRPAALEEHKTTATIGRPRSIHER